MPKSIEAAIRFAVLLATRYELTPAEAEGRALANVDKLDSNSAEQLADEVGAAPNSDAAFYASIRARTRNNERRPRTGAERLNNTEGTAARRLREGGQGI